MNIASTNNYIFGRNKHEWAEFNYLETNTAHIRIENYTSPKYIVDWGDGNVEYVNNNVEILHTYLEPYTGVVKITPLNGDLNDVKTVRFSALNDTVYNNKINFTDQEIRQFNNLDKFELNSGNVSFGNFSGNLNDLQPSLTKISLITNSTSEWFADLNTFHTEFQEITLFNNFNDLDITGTINNLTDYLSLKFFKIYGKNSLTGNIENIISTSLNVFHVSGINTITGSIINIPINIPNLTFLQISGMNTLSGNINSFSTLPLINLLFSGNNTITGDVINLPTTLVHLVLQGNNSIGGNLSSLSLTNLITFWFSGPNINISGNINTLPNTITSLILTYGNNTISGNISNLPNNLNYLVIGSGNNTILGYSGKDWPDNIRNITISFKSGYGLTSSELDNLIIDLDNTVVNWTLEKTLFISNPDNSRTSFSDSALSSLLSKGVIVTIF